MSRILIGIPTRNRPELVREAVRSVMDQSFQDFRVIVTDNASESEAARSVEDFILGLNDPRFSYHLQPVDRGEYGQGRFLMEQCSEEFFLILHDDDLLGPTYLATALARMDENRDLACFVANPYIFVTDGGDRDELTHRYLRDHGRHRHDEGELDILEPLLRYGFIPISGTFFRTAALVDSGFVDEDCHGNYPFEFNVLLRLGQNGGRAYFTTAELLGFRVHEQSLRNTLHVQFNEHVVSTMVKLLERRRFQGACEHLRKRVLSYSFRHFAMIRLVRGDKTDCYRCLAQSIRLNPVSYRNWLYLFGALFFPFLVRPALRPKVVLC